MTHQRAKPTDLNFNEPVIMRQQQTGIHGAGTAGLAASEIRL